jgi:hypothetical protein
VESFNGRLRDELRSSEIFDTLAEAKHLVERWILHYKHRRIQRVLGRLAPAAFAARCPAEPPLRLAGTRALRHRRSKERSLPSSVSHNGWTDESDPVEIIDETGASTVATITVQDECVAADLANLLTNWGGSGAGDIDGNGTVEPGDLTSLLAAWTG